MNPALSETYRGTLASLALREKPPTLIEPDPLAGDRTFRMAAGLVPTCTFGIAPRLPSGTEAFVGDAYQYSRCSAGAVEADPASFVANEIFSNVAKGTIPYFVGHAEVVALRFGTSEMISPRHLYWTEYQSGVIAPGDAVGDQITTEIELLRDGWAGPHTLAPPAEVRNILAGLLPSLAAWLDSADVEVDPSTGAVALRWFSNDGKQALSVTILASLKVVAVHTRLDGPGDSWTLMPNQASSVGKVLRNIGFLNGRA